MSGIEPPWVLIDLSTHPARRRSVLLRRRVRIDDGRWSKVGWVVWGSPVSAGPHVVEIQLADWLHSWSAIEPTRIAIRVGCRLRHLAGVGGRESSDR